MRIHYIAVFISYVSLIPLRFLPQVKQTYILLMYFPYTRGEDFTDYAKMATWNLLHAYIDAHRQRLKDEYPGNVLQPIKILQPQCTGTNFSEKSRYNILFQQVVHKGGDLAINYIKIFQNYQALEFSVENSYSEDQVIHTFLDDFHQGGKYSSQIARHQEELRRGIKKK